eukprot:TRINITY_DN13169_c0_g1_i1.p1 TRINITY_DN13169_c0_g1~~TRINITY_DN13169_c0_g1_i1.p1  ORF type:complete len:122 (-),score=30.79 TRINITY_DN13169_c0_g1_i1:53-418(-)
MEEMWAEKAAKHSETYLKVLKAFKEKKKIKLTKADDTIYSHFRSVFPTVPVEKLEMKHLKSAKAIKEWREFCLKYDDGKIVADYNYGTLLRLKSSLDYTQDNNGRAVQQECRDRSRMPSSA